MQRRSIRGQILLVAFQERPADRDFRDVFIFYIYELEVADDLRLDLFLRQDLNDIDIELPGDQVAEGIFIAALIHEVTEKNEDSLAAALDAETAERPFQVA